MRTRIRKNDLMPESLEGMFAERELFPHLEALPQSVHAKRVERILKLLSHLGQGDSNAFFQKGDMLSRYQWHYGLTFSKSRGLRADLVFTNGLTEEDAWEHRAVRFLMSLIPDRLNRLRQCKYDGCKGWFFAEKRSDQDFCKRGNCRQNHYDNDEKHKKQKCALMAKNRIWHRDDKQQARRKTKGA